MIDMSSIDESKRNPVRIIGGPSPLLIVTLVAVLSLSLGGTGIFFLVKALAKKEEKEEKKRKRKKRKKKKRKKRT